MNASQVRNFLLAHPKPVSVRVRTIDGEEKVLKPKNYAKCADSIVALEPELIECLDKDGNLLRARRADASAPNPSDDPALPEVLRTDPQAASFALYARLLHRAYEHSTEVAFARMVEIVERMGERADAIERRLERAEADRRNVLERQIEDAFERAEAAAEGAEGAQAGPLQTIMERAFMSGMAAQAAGKPPPRSNGTTSNGKG
jgi:hypothetical protein